MKILSWNVNGRVRKACQRQLEAVIDENPDVLALQEVTATSYPVWAEGLKAAGYHVLSTLDLVGRPYHGVGRRSKRPIKRKYFNLVAAREPMTTLPELSFPDPEQARVAFPEKYLAATVVADGVEIDVHNAHLPPGSTRGIIKVHAFQAIRRGVDHPTSRPRILCGDFNTPLAEDADGVTPAGRNHPGLRDEWEAAERAILCNPELRDVYREVHPAGEPYPASHFTRGTPRRYDHIYASQELEVGRCRYLTEWLEKRLSDHAPVEAELSVRTGAGSPDPDQIADRRGE